MCTTYTTTGPVRGSCAHTHRTVGAARACIARDGAGVRKGHGESAYSDRRVVAVEDGVQRELTEQEADEEAPRYPSGPSGRSGRAKAPSPAQVVRVRALLARLAPHLAEASPVPAYGVAMLAAALGIPADPIGRVLSGRRGVSEETLAGWETRLAMTEAAFASQMSTRAPAWTP